MTKYEKIADLYDGVILAKAPIDSFVEQDINAHSMSREMFSQLTENIKENGVMESFPLSTMTDRGIEIISGHHRMRAVRAAGIDYAFTILYVNGLSRDEIISKQLSHNSIFGEDDPELVKRLFNSIGDVDLQISAFVDPSMFKIDFKGQTDITDINIQFDYIPVSIVFFPEQKNRFDEAIEALGEKNDEILIADKKYFDEFKKALNTTKEFDNIKSVGATLARMSQIVMDYYDTQEKAK